MSINLENDSMTQVVAARNGPQICCNVAEVFKIGLLHQVWGMLEKRFGSVDVAREKFKTCVRVNPKNAKTYQVRSR